MIGSAHAQHDAQVMRIADRLRNQGYLVIKDPGADDLPFDLDGYKPDLLARRDQNGLLIEVKSRADRLSFDWLQPVVEEVKRHSGWRFLLVTSQDISDADLLLDGLDHVTWDEITRRIRHAHSLETQGDQEAAYIILWIAFEQMLRLQAAQVNLPIERLSSSILIRQLYSLGELTMEQFDIALACLDVRNRVAHGLPCPDLTTAYEGLRDLTRDLVREWSATENAA